LYNISANTIFTGKTQIYLPTCHSTNEYACNLLTNENPLEGTLIITHVQTAGKGQRGSSWEAEPGKNLTFSLIFKPFFLSIDRQFYLNIIISLAVRDTVAEFLQTSLKIKWPNDIYLNNKKIAGILIQNSLQKNHLINSVVGIGLNVNQELFSDKKAISMMNHAGKELPLETILAVLLEKIEANYLKLKTGDQTTLMQRYLSHLFRYNEQHSFLSQGNSFLGIIEGIEESGRLIIQTESDRKTFDFKEVEFYID
jgi:BirA family transcriptional regulator, biotin operon repressor / biotin---[acetyl-CoA-carboxylase] ligase